MHMDFEHSLDSWPIVSLSVMRGKANISRAIAESFEILQAKEKKGIRVLPANNTQKKTILVATREVQNSIAW